MQAYRVVSPTASVTQFTVRQLGSLFLQATRTAHYPAPPRWRYFMFTAFYKQLAPLHGNSVCLVTTDEVYDNATRESALLAKAYFRVGVKRGALSNRLSLFCNITPGMGLFNQLILLNSSGSDNFLRELRVQTNLYNVFTIFRRLSDKRLINHCLLQEALQRDESLYLVFLYIYLTGHLLARLRTHR
jgi:hypothetical protein